jgi:enoyl-CoA hydratase
MASPSVISVERAGHVACVWLDRPEARNAMGTSFFAQIGDVFADVGADPDVRAVVIAARGPHFTVGLDLKEIGATLAGPGIPAAEPGQAQPNPPGQVQPNPPSTPTGRPSAAAQAFATRKGVLRMQQAITAVADCPKPVIAAIHGYCIGGGVDLITACDIRLASADARLSVRETKVAIVADLGTLQRLPRLIPRGHVAELAFTGKDIDAERARQIGLVNEVYSDAAAVQAAALALAADIAANPPLAVQGTKAVLAASADRSVAEGLDYVATWNAGMLQSADLVEAMAAFLEKRPPTFTGG